MDLGEAMIARGQAAATVAGDGFYWNERPQGSALPCCVFRCVGGFSDDPLEGDADFAESRVQGDCLAETNAEAKRLARQVTAAFKDAADQGDFLFWNADIDRPIDLTEVVAGKTLHRASLNMLIRHGAES